MDLTQITAAIGLASAATGLTGQAAEAAEKVKGLFGGGKAPDAEKAQAAVNDLAAKLTAANMMNVQISSALRELSDALQKEDEYSRRKAGYQLVKTERGDIVFQSNLDGEPEHYLCPVCLQADRIFSFIRVTELGGGRCQTNKEHNFSFFEPPKIERPTPRNSWIR